MPEPTDKKRLDWLEGKKRSRITLESDLTAWCLSRRGQKGLIVKRDIRAAIDAAMKREGEKS